MKFADFDRLLFYILSTLFKSILLFSHFHSTDVIFFFQCGILTCYHFLNKLWLFSFYSLLGCFNWKLFFLWKHPYCPSFFNRSKAFRTHSFSFRGPREKTNLFLGQHCCFQIIVCPLSLNNLMSSEIFAIKVVHWTSWQCTDL